MRPQKNSLLREFSDRRKRWLQKQPGDLKAKKAHVLSGWVFSRKALLPPSPSLPPTFLFSSLPNTKSGIDNIWVGLVRLDFIGGRYKDSGKKK